MNASLFKTFDQLLSAAQEHVESIGGRVQDRLPDLPLSFPTPVVRWTETSVRQEDENLVLQVGLPGFSPENLELSVENDGEVDVLIIEATPDNYDESQEDKGVKRFATPVWERPFRQVFDIPDGVEKDSITANMKNGLLILTISLPDKSKEEETSRKIHVNLS